MNNLTTQQAKEIAKKAYIFGFPFVANYRVFMHPLISGNPLMQGADFNEFAHNRQLFPPSTADTTQRDTIFSRHSRLAPGADGHLGPGCAGKAGLHAPVG